MTSFFSKVNYTKGLSDIGYYQKSTNAAFKRNILIYENYTSNRYPTNATKADEKLGEN